MRSSDKPKVTKGQYSNPMIEKAKACGIYNKFLNVIRTLRFRNCTDEEIVKALNGAFKLFGINIDVNGLRRSLFVYQDLAAAYMTGRDASIGMLTHYIEETIETSEKTEKMARLALDYLKEIDDGTVIKTTDMKEGIQLTATGQTLSNLIAALGPIGEPAPPDESDLEFDRQQQNKEDDLK